MSYKSINVKLYIKLFINLNEEFEALNQATKIFENLIISCGWVFIAEICIADTQICQIWMFVVFVTVCLWKVWCGHHQQWITANLALQTV